MTTLQTTIAVKSVSSLEILGKLQAGFLEKSNTDITDEIVLMLRTQQAFNGCSKMMQSDIDVTKKLSAR